ncbi:MAG: hypothetical protein ACKOEP_06375 [Phycisphaerales bacterium]
MNSSAPPPKPSARRRSQPAALSAKARWLAAGSVRDSSMPRS